MRIAVAQPPTTPYDVAANSARHAELVRQAAADVVVFPELSLTGYHFDADPLNTNERKLDPLVRACTESGSLAFAGAPVTIDGEKFIAMLAISTEVSVAYCKMYLGSDEETHFGPGAEPAVIEHQGARLGLAICKDTGIDAHADATCAKGIDIYVAGVLEHHADVQVIDDRARRIATKHAVWVATASFADATGEGYDLAAGQSGIWRPDGTVAAQAGRKPGEVVVMDIPISS